MNSKNDIIVSGKYRVFLEKKKELFLNGKDSYNSELYSDILTLEETKNCIRIYNNNRARKKRNNEDLIMWNFAKDTIPRYKDYKIIMGTLTFKDKALKDTDKKTRRVMVTRYLRKTADNYMENIDYSPKTEREHYHFIAFTKNKFDINKWKYGGGKFKVVKNTPKDMKNAKDYSLNKLTNHAYKESTKLERIVKDKNPILEKEINLIWIDRYIPYKLHFIDKYLTTNN